MNDLEVLKNDEDPRLFGLAIMVFAGMKQIKTDVDLYNYNSKLSELSEDAGELPERALFYALNWRLEEYRQNTATIH